MSNSSFFAGLALAATVSGASAQLAITEIMSSSSTNLGPSLVVGNSDFWELTNFGTNAVDLTGYRWNDNAGGLIGADPAPFSGLLIEPGESVIFFEFTASGSTNAEQFRAWWGLPASVRCFSYLGNGLSSAGDGVLLWGPAATVNEDLVDRVDFAEAVRGQSFVYVPSSGIFASGNVSTNGVGGAFKASTADDVGSPGLTTGPVPLSILAHPTNLAVNPGDTVVFRVTAAGLPRPRYQWQRDGSDIPGARGSTLVISNALTGDVGSYQAIVDNGFESAVSTSATLALNAEPKAPELLAPTQEQRVFIGQTATFTAIASGVPQPTYQWRRNGVAIPGATANSYVISGAQISDEGAYSVVIRNLLGALTNQAALVVTRRPRLVITEIMPAQSTNGPFRGHNDWFELTNFDDFTVDLRGYRIDDGSAALVAATTVTNAELRIAPGESIVFVEAMSIRTFRSWWGPANLDGVRIVPYSGAGLGLSSLGDGIVLWNSGAADNADTIAAEVYSTATVGVSFGFDPGTETFGDLSVVGEDGAFVAPENGDIGSPGFLRNIPNPRNLQLRPGTSGGVEFRWQGERGKRYILQSAPALGAAEWTTVATVLAADPIVGASDPAGFTGPQRFYRVQVEP